MVCKLSFGEQSGKKCMISKRTGCYLAKRSSSVLHNRYPLRYSRANINRGGFLANVAKLIMVSRTLITGGPSSSEKKKVVFYLFRG